MLPHLSPQQVRRRAAKLRVKVTAERRSNVQCSNGAKRLPKRNVDAAYFTNPSTPEAAYVLGLLWADGYLLKKKGSYRIGLENITADAATFRPILFQAGRWTESNRQRPGRQSQTSFTTSNRDLHGFLSSNGYLEKSTASADSILATIPESLRCFWFRGYFDGDGCIYLNASQHLYQVSFAGSYSQNWTFITTILNSLSIRHRVVRREQIRKQGSSTHSSVVRFGGKNQLLRFGSYLYSDIPTLGLDRKRRKFLQVASSISAT